jgi:hypothetical protein
MAAALHPSSRIHCSETLSAASRGQVLTVDPELNAIIVHGSVPGKPGNVLELTPAKIVGVNYKNQRNLTPASRNVKVSWPSSPRLAAPLLTFSQSSIFLHYLWILVQHGIPDAREVMCFLSCSISTVRHTFWHQSFETVLA